MIRPQPARWFEIVVARDDAFTALESLASACCVEVEWHETDRLPGASGAAAEMLKEVAELARNYRPYWPAAALRLAAARSAPAQMLASALATLRAWAREADPLIARIQAAEAAASELALAEAALRELSTSRLDFAALARAENGVTAGLFALPLGVELELPPAVLARIATLPTERLLLVVAAPEVVEDIARRVADVNGRRARFPDWLQPTAQANIERVAERREEEVRTAQCLRADLEGISRRRGLSQALATIARASWCFEHGGAIHTGDLFARVTGWTVDPQRVVDSIERCGARAVVAFPRAPREARPPLVLRNPWWAQPFEFFTRLVGMPGTAGADPSALLAFAVPLIFGYMFGDVGQGLTLALAGWLLRDRLPVLRLLVPGGIAAAGFGFVFGSVFSLETIVHPLWVPPLEHPLPVLLAPVAGGAILLAVGLLIGAIEAVWERRVSQWLREDAPVLATYIGIALGFIDPAGWVLAAAGAAWAMLGAAFDEKPASGALAGVGHWIEHTLQLAINTLSFARVGAFALAHAGLSSAVVALADAAEQPFTTMLILVLGNVIVMLIEGLVVSIQTTRLVLFEFFTRFFRPEGREFRPLAVPPVTTEES
jgi:V/A-type H+-transporting ATPase subunit I